MYFFNVNKNNPQLSENPEPKKILVQVSLLFRWPPKTWKGISTEKVYGGKKKKKKILTLHEVFQGHRVKTFSAQKKQK